MTPPLRTLELFAGLGGLGLLSWLGLLYLVLFLLDEGLLDAHFDFGGEGLRFGREAIDLGTVRHPSDAGVEPGPNRATASR